MADRDLHCCQCPACLSGADLPNRYLHHHMNLLFGHLDEQHRHWFASMESKKLGHGGDTCVALILGLHVDTIRRGREELDSELAGRPTYCIPTPGAERPSVSHLRDPPAARCCRSSLDRPRAGQKRRDSRPQPRQGGSWPAASGTDLCPASRPPPSFASCYN